MLSIAEADRWLAACAGRRVLVAGDLMLDRYVTGSVNRISPEAPVPVVHVSGEYARPGGAANVALNIQALGGQAVIAGLVGRDGAGDELLQALNERGIDTAGVLRVADLRTTVKTRVIAERQQVVRVDREDPPERARPAEAAFVALLATVAPTVAGMVIEDYGKGALTQPVVNALLAGRRAGVPVGLDPKDNHDLRIEGITLATPNYKEACTLARLREEPLNGDLTRHPNLARAGEILQNLWRSEIVIITLGAHGMYLHRDGRAPVVIPTRAREVFDVCGAGDTVIAATVLARAAGADFETAAKLATEAAGVVVGKLGAATCTPAEMRASLSAGHT